MRRMPLSHAMRAPRVRGMTALVLATSAAAPVAAQLPVPTAEAAVELPFGTGEVLRYQARIPRLAADGSGVMRVDAAPEGMLLLHFDFEARVGIVDVEDCTRSWLDPERMAAHRYRKRERSPLLSRTESVEIEPAARRWQAQDGRRGTSPTSRPLDELSFLYFIRTLPLQDRATYSFDRHFDPGRNPVVVRVVGRERVRVPAGEFDAVVVEMRVQDGDRFGGAGVLRLHLSDDAHRAPLRIETAMPLAGSVILELTERSH